MTDSVNTRELVLEMLLEINEKGQYSHLILRDVLNKYQYLSKQERSFLTRVTEGTLELTIGKKVLVLEAGDSIYFDATQPHAMRALNGKAVKFLAIIF